MVNAIEEKMETVGQGLCDRLYARLQDDLHRASARSPVDITYDADTHAALPLGFTKYFAMMTVLAGGSLEGRSILDIGCGGGGFMAQAFGLGMDTTGIDIYDGQAESREAAERILTAYGMERDEIAQRVRYGDITKPVGQLEGQFDFAISIGMLEHIPQPEERARAVENMMRTLRPGGTLFLTCGPNRWFPVDIVHYGPRFPFFHWLPAWVRRRYLDWFIIPRLPDLKPVGREVEFLSGLRVSEIRRAIQAVSPGAVIYQAFPVLTRLSVTRAWLKRRDARAIVALLSRLLTRFDLEPSIVVVAQR